MRKEVIGHLFVIIISRGSPAPPSSLVAGLMHVNSTPVLLLEIRGSKTDGDGPGGAN